MTTDELMSKIRPRSEVPEDTYEMWFLPTDTLAEYDRVHALYQEYQDHDVIQYKPLKRFSDGTWLISVRGSVYELPEKVLEAGMDGLPDHLQYAADNGNDEEEPDIDEARLEELCQALERKASDSRRYHPEGRAAYCDAAEKLRFVLDDTPWMESP